MKKLLLTGLLLSVGVTVQAQKIDATVGPAQPATHADSAAVIRQAFRSARRFARFGTFAEGTAAGMQVVILSSGQLADAPVKQALSISSAAVYSGFLVVFLDRWVRFSQAREEQAVQRFELHQPQPRYVRRQLITHAIRQGRH